MVNADVDRVVNDRPDACPAPEARSAFGLDLSNEGLSLLENAAHIGLPIPDRMKDVLAQLHGRTDEKKDETQEDEQE